MPNTTSPEDKSFSWVAPYYDHLMRSVPYRMWTSYYLLLLAHQQAHPHRVLDVCCGTGTMCEMLTDEGLEMTGFDLSPGMISEAKKKARKKKADIQYFVADASEFDLGIKFDAALSFFDSLNNILEPEKLRNAFQCVANHLLPNGSWVFDLNTAYAFEAQLFDQECLRANAKLRYQWKGDWNPETRTIEVDMHFWHKEVAFHEVHRQRAYEETEVREMLEDAGFVDVRAFHSYSLNPPRAKSDRLHYIARKPG